MLGKLFNPENGLMITMSWITDCLFLSLLWLFFSVFLIPLGPATAALYDTAVHTFRYKEEGVYRRFFRSFQKNLKTGIPAGVICLITGWLGYTAWNRIAASSGNSDEGYMLLWGYFVILLLILGIITFLFPLLSRFEIGLVQLFKNGILLCMIHLPRTIILSFLSVVTIWLCLWLWWPVIFMPCLSALIASVFIEPVFLPYMPEEESFSEPEEEEPLSKDKGRDKGA